MFWEIEISIPKTKIFLIFSQNSFCYISGNRTFLKTFLFFRRELSELKKKKQKKTPR